MGKIKVFVVAIIILVAVMGAVAITSASRAIQESNRTIERIDRKIELYTNNH